MNDQGDKVKPSMSRNEMNVRLVIFWVLLLTTGAFMGRLYSFFVIMLAGFAYALTANFFGYYGWRKEYEKRYTITPVRMDK